MECILEYQQIFPTLILLILVGLFFTYNKGWVINNKLLFSFLVLSVIMIGGEFLPVWWKFGAQYYDLIYALGLSFLTGFFLYWLTVGREEITKKEYYDFYSLLFLFDYYELISHFYIRNKYKKMLKENEGKYKNIKNIKLQIDLPSESIFNILDESQNLIEEILNHYEEDKIEIEINRKKDLELYTRLYQKEDLKITSETNSNNKKDSEIKAINLLEQMYKIENKFLVKIYKKICNKRKIFKSEFTTYLNMDNVQEIDQMKFILDYTSDNLNGELNQIEYFLKNHKYIESKINPLIRKKIGFLSLQKKFIPGISLELTPSNFGSLNLRVINSLINDFYSEKNKRYYRNNDKNYIEYKIIKIIEKNDGFYMILFNDEEINLDTITSICIDTSGVLFF